MSSEIKTLFQLFGYEETLRMALEATEKLRKWKEAKNNKETLSPKAQELKEHCISLGPPGVKWAKICSILVGERIEIEDPYCSFPFEQFACIVPLASKEHGYRGGEPIFMLFSESVRAASPPGPETTQVRCLNRSGGMNGFYKPTLHHTMLASNELIEKTVYEIFSVLDSKEAIFIGGTENETF